MAGMLERFLHRLPVVSLLSYVTTATPSSIVLAVVVIFVLSRIQKLYSGLRAVGGLNGMCIPFQPMAFPGVILPTMWWNPGMLFVWDWRYSIYKKFRGENISFVPFLIGKPTICTSNLDVVRQITSGGRKSGFIKPAQASLALSLYGENLVSVDGEDWRKHRRIVGPAFTNDLYQLVWSQTLQTYREMVHVERWNDKKENVVPSIQKYTYKLALLIIGNSGFGFPFNWSTPPKSNDGSMSFDEALTIVAESIQLVLFAPKWILKLPFARLKLVQRAHIELIKFMQDHITEKKRELKVRKEMDQLEYGDLGRDIFTLLVKANEDESQKFPLNDDELIGNVFVMLFAGHETTAQTLAVALGFLAVNPDIQNEVVQQILSVVGWDRDAVFEDYSKLDKVLAAFYEALRMFPPAFVMLREAGEDTILKIPNPLRQEGSTTIPVLKGTQILVDMVGIQYNPRYFDDPEKYRPSRWYGISNDSEAFTAFSVGPRACIGRKFATTEAVCFLAMLLRDWRVEPLLREGETTDTWGKRVLDAKIELTLGVKDVPLRFHRRERK